MRGTAPFRWDLLIKIGGSLGRGRSLRPLMHRIALLAGRRRLLVIPGGGVFADLVRDQAARVRADDRTAHHMALLAMDQYGLLLSSLTCRSTVVDNLRAAELVAEAGRVPILLASSMMQRDSAAERSFRLTSDSIAALLAGRLRASQLVLLKSIRGRALRIRNRASSEALARRGVVDPLFSETLSPRTTAWILYGRRPSELDRFMPAVRRRADRGTRITRRSAPVRRARRAAPRETL